MTTKYGFGKTIPMDFERAIDVVTEALKTEGFSALTDFASIAINLRGHHS